MRIDCDSCPARRGDGCADCPLAALDELGTRVAGLWAEEIEAIEILARAGLEVEVLSAPVTRRRWLRVA